MKFFLTRSLVIQIGRGTKHFRWDEGQRAKKPKSYCTNTSNIHACGLVCLLFWFRNFFRFQNLRFHSVLSRAPMWYLARTKPMQIRGLQQAPPLGGWCLLLSLSFMAFLLSRRAWLFFQIAFFFLMEHFTNLHVILCAGAMLSSLYCSSFRICAAKWIEYDSQIF